MSGAYRATRHDLSAPLWQNRPMNLPIAVVTGASSGIGAAAARVLSSTHKVFCVARRSERIEALASEGITLGCDVGRYCPEAPVSRAEMAVFLTRTFRFTLH